MVTPQSSLISTLQKRKKWLIALFLIASIGLAISIFITDKESPVNTKGELNRQLNKKAGAGGSDLVDKIAQSPNLTYQSNDAVEKELLSQTGDASVSEEFCMVDSIKFNFPYMVISTFTNLKNEACDTKSLYGMNISSIKAQLIPIEHAQSVTRSGPFGYAMTKNLSFSDHPFIYIGIQRFTQYSTLRLGIMDVIKNPSLIFGDDIIRALAFYPLKTKENISIYFAPDKMAHALVDPQGTVYLLSAFNKRLLPELNRENLSVISGLIDPPKGWKFVSEVISKPIYINKRSDGGYRNVRVVDNLGNIYIMLSEEHK